jgi:hypothetical protein
MSIKYDRYEFKGIVFDPRSLDTIFAGECLDRKRPAVLVSFFEDIGQNVEYIRYQNSFIQTNCIDIKSKQRSYRALVCSTIIIGPAGKISAVWTNGIPKRLKEETISGLKQHNLFVLNFITACFRNGFIKIKEDEEKDETIPY